MSVQTKKRFKNLGRAIGIALFAFLMFTNIKIALMDDAEIASGDISVLGIELNLFEATFADETGGASCTVTVDCYNGGTVSCTSPKNDCQRDAPYSVTCDGKETTC